MFRFSFTFLVVFFSIYYALLKSTFADNLFHIFLDIDETLVDDFHYSCELDSKEILLSKYVLTYGARELIYSLVVMPNVKLHFLSAGPDFRNEALLKQLILPDGRSAFDAVEGRVYSKDFISKLSKFEKDLTSIVRAQDLPNTLILDDSFRHIPFEQRKNLLWLPEPKEEDFDSSIRWAKYFVDREGLNSRFSFSSRHCTKDLNRLVRSMGLLVKAMKATTKDLSLVDTLSSFQWKDSSSPSPENYKWELIWDTELFKLGIESFSRWNPSYRAVVVLPYTFKDFQKVFDSKIQEIYNYIESISKYEHLVFLTENPFAKPIHSDHFVR